MSSITQSFLNFIFPPPCVHCRREGAWLCPRAIELLQAEQAMADPITVVGIDRMVIRGSYDNAILGAIIRQIKYHYWTALSEVFDGVLSPCIPLLGSLPSETIIIPVPLHTRRQKERGFNQAVLIARSLSRLTDYPVQAILQRTRYTKPQAKLGESERHRNIDGAFVVRPTLEMTPLCGILVDDVLTTGSTLSECASVLRQAGVKHIIAVALAKG